jgi:hypothetical protein
MSLLGGRVDYHTDDTTYFGTTPLSVTMDLLRLVDGGYMVTFNIPDRQMSTSIQANQAHTVTFVHDYDLPANMYFDANEMLIADRRNGTSIAHLSVSSKGSLKATWQPVSIADKAGFYPLSFTARVRVTDALVPYYHDALFVGEEELLAALQQN